MSSTKEIKIVLWLYLLCCLGCKTSSIKPLDMNNFSEIAKYYAEKNKKYTKKFKSFEIWKEPPDSLGFIIYYVSPGTNPYAPSREKQSLEKLPTHFVKISGNVFFWRENEFDLPTSEVIEQLNKVGLLDSTYIKVDLGIIKAEDAVPPSIETDETIKTAKYFVCNNDGKMKYELYSPYAFSKGKPKHIRCD